MTLPVPTTPQAQGTPPPQSSAAPPKFTFSMPEDDEYLNGLIFGEYGSGKSTLAATAAHVPQMQDVLYLAAEAGEKVLVPFAKEGHLKVVRIKNYPMVARVYEWLVLHCRYRDANDIEKLTQLEAMIPRAPGMPPPDRNPMKFRTVVLDSLTEIQAYLMYMLLGINIGQQRLDLPPDTAEFKEWGQSSDMIKLLIRSFRDLGLNVIIVCAMEEKEDERKRQLKRLLLPGKLATNVQGFLDFVGYLETAKVEPSPEAPLGKLWRLNISSGQTFHAKNRFGPQAPAYIDAPDMTKLFALNQAAPKEPMTDGSAAADTTPSSQSAPTRPAAASGVRAPVRVAGRG